MPASPTQQSTPPKSRRAGFRDDIQGMRALAMLGILAFHAGVSPYSGGFVTLDVFFVISGFLIASLLLREVSRTGTVNLPGFYARRARRILPAAAVATVGTVVASYLWLSLVEAEDAAYDAVWSAFFAANIRFALEETDYFAQEEAVSPLQHFWSLAVEEQFYLVLPAVLLISVLIVRRRARPGGTEARDPMRTIGLVLIGISALSLAWSIVISTRSPETAYFSTFTRSWEFGVGALLALYAPRLAPSLTARARNLLAALGLAAIAVAMFAVSSTTPFPGYAALLPVLGTAAVILAGAEIGEHRTPVMQRLIGIAPLRVIGDASYSLYLWHWPVLVVAEQHLARELRPVELALVLGVTAVLTWASFRFVETPFRRGMPPRLGRGLVLYPVALALVVGSSAAAIASINRELSNGNPPIRVADYDRTPDGKKLSKDTAVARVQASAKAALEGAPIPGDLRPGLLDLKTDKADLGDCQYEGPPWDLCRRGDPDGEKTLVLLGNSHARHWVPAMEKIAREHGYAAYYLVKSRCTAARVETVLAGDSEPWQECTDFNAWAEEQLAELQPDLVVISTSGAPGVHVDGEVVSDAEGVADALRTGYEQLLDDVTPLADRVAVLSDVPRRSRDIGECLGRRDATLKTCVSKPAARAERVAEISKEVTRASSALLVDTTPWFCADGWCAPVIGSTIPMRDRGHITTAYAKELAEPLARELGIGDKARKAQPK